MCQDRFGNEYNPHGLDRARFETVDAFATRQREEANAQKEIAQKRELFERNETSESE